MGRHEHEPVKIPVSKPDTNKPDTSPDPADYPGYAETKPCTKEQAQIPGAKQPPDGEEGGLEYEPDPGP